MGPAFSRRLASARTTVFPPVIVGTYRSSDHWTARSATRRTCETGMVPPLTPSSALTGWTADLPTIGLVVVLGAGYVAAVRRCARGADTPWPRSRHVAFGVGLGLLALMGVSFVGRYADTLFWVRALQVITLLMVVP